MCDVRKIKRGDPVSFRPGSSPFTLHGVVRDFEIQEPGGFETTVYFIYVHVSGNVYAVPSKNILSSGD